MTSIIRPKMAVRRRRLEREVPGSSAAMVAADPSASKALQDGREREETYIRTIDAIRTLFPEHPEEMSSVVLSLIDGHPVRANGKLLEASESTVFRRLRSGIALLKRSLGS